MKLIQTHVFLILPNSTHFSINLSVTEIFSLFLISVSSDWLVFIPYKGKEIKQYIQDRCPSSYYHFYSSKTSGKISLQFLSSSFMDSAPIFCSPILWNSSIKVPIFYLLSTIAIVLYYAAAECSFCLI